MDRRAGDRRGKERERETLVRMGKETHRNGPSTQKTQVELEIEQMLRYKLNIGRVG